MRVRWLIGSLVVVSLGCGREDGPVSEPDKSPKTRTPPATPTAESSPAVTPTPTPPPDPPHLQTIGLVTLGWSSFIDASGVEVLAEGASARFANSDYWWFEPDDTWDMESACSVYEPMPDGWSWWDPVDVGERVILTGPAVLDLPATDARPGIHGLTVEPGTIPAGDYRVSWEGGVADEDVPIYALPAMEIEGLTLPPRLELHEPDVDPALEIEPGFELRWDAADVTNRFELTLYIQDECTETSSAVRMQCRLVDDGHFVFPAQVNDLPVGRGHLVITRETLRRHPVDDTQEILLRGRSTVVRSVRNDHGTACADLYD